MRAAEHGGLLDAHAVRHGVAILGAGIAELREGAEPVAAHDAVAELEAGDAVADRDDFAGPLVAGDEGRLRAELVFPGEHQDIHVLHAARLDAHLYLARSGRRRIGQLAQGQHLGTAERLANNRSHALCPRCPGAIWDRAMLSPRCGAAQCGGIVACDGAVRDARVAAGRRLEGRRDERSGYHGEAGRQRDAGDDGRRGGAADAGPSGERAAGARPAAAARRHHQRGRPAAPRRNRHQRGAGRAGSNFSPRRDG